MKIAILQLWQHRSLGSPESEDWCSLHLTREDHRNFMRKHWEAMPEDPPRHYVSEFGNAMEIEVSDALYRKIEKGRGEGGIRLQFLPREIAELVPAEFTNLNQWKAHHISVGVQLP